MNTNRDPVSNPTPISKPTLSRMPKYLNYLYQKKKNGIAHISSTVMAEELNLNPVKVRKDLERTGTTGKPKTGFDIDELIHNITDLLGYNNSNEAVLVGAGRLGRTLLSYDGFANYGLNIVAAFDIDESICNREIDGKQVFHISKVKELVGRLKVHIGIVTVPAKHAQEICDLLIESGILAVWNFAPVHLRVPEPILVQNEDMAASLAILSQHLKDQL